MASGKIKGITVEIGGDTTKLGNAISDVEKNTRSLQGELRQVEKLLKMDPGNTELLAQKQRILTQAVEETSAKLKILKEAEAQVQEQFNKGDIGEDQLRAFQREVIKTESDLKSLENQLNGTSDDFEEVGDSAEESGDGFTVMKGALADLVSNAIQGAVSMIGDLVSSLLELSEATEEYRTMQAKLSGASKTFGYDMEFANKQYKEFYKYCADDQMSTNAITNLMGIGTSTESVSKLAKGATAVWASYGDSIPIESLTESINETITVGKVTGTMADTINWAKDANVNLKNALSGNKEAQKAYTNALKEGMPVEDAFNEALAKVTDEQERADIVAKFLNSTYGESKKTFDELNGSVLDAHEAELKLKETQAQLGEAVSPLNTALTNLKTQALEAITPLVTKLANGFLKMLNTLRQHPAVMQAVAGVVVVLATAFTVLATALGIQALINGVRKAFMALNLTMLSNPIVLIVALIAGLVAAFIYLWNTCDGFRQFWINLWNIVSSFFKSIWSGIQTFVLTIIPNMISGIVNWFAKLPGQIHAKLSNVLSRVSAWGSNMVSKGKQSASNFLNSVISFFKELPGKIASALVGAITAVGSWGAQMLSTAKAKMSAVVNGIIGCFKSLPGKMVSIGKSVIDGVISGISGSVGRLYDSIKTSLSGLVDKAKDALGINSPSKVFANIVGSAIPEGIAKGINDNSNIANDAIKTMSAGLTDPVNINTATIDRKLANTFSSPVPAIDNGSLLDKLNGIYDRLGRLQIVLDTGTLVGETIDKIDSNLANRQILSARGV